MPPVAAIRFFTSVEVSSRIFQPYARIVCGKSREIECPEPGAASSQAEAFRLRPKDDQMLVAQAITEPLHLLTSDEKLQPCSDLVVLVQTLSECLRLRNERKALREALP